MRVTDQVNESLEDLLEILIREGMIPDDDKARRRLQLGYPAWLVLEDLGPEGVAAVLSQATSIPLLEGQIKSDDASQQRTANIAVAVKEGHNYGPVILKARRWAPLVDGRVAIADPFGPLPDGILADRELCIASACEIDRALNAAFPRECESGGREARRLGRLLLGAGYISEKDLAEALDEQARSGGRLDEIFLAHGVVDAAAITRARASKLGYSLPQAGEEPVPLLPVHQARTWRAVPLATGSEEAVRMKEIGRAHV